MIAQDVFDMAVTESNLNDSAILDDLPWLDFLTSYEQRVFVEAARLNPDYFGREGATATRGSSTASWSLSGTPGNVASVQRVVVDAIVGTVSGISIGTEVNLVSVRNPEVALAPRAYVRDKTVFEYGSELQTDSSNYVSRLKVWYSFLPSARTAVGDNLDVPTEHVLLVVLPLAALFATRDQRPDDAAQLMQEYTMEREIFLRHVGVFDEGVVRDLKAVPARAPQP